MWLYAECFKAKLPQEVGDSDDQVISYGISDHHHSDLIDYGEADTVEKEISGKEKIE
jgi:hypothetical protein